MLRGRYFYIPVMFGKYQAVAYCFFQDGLLIWMTSLGILSVLETEGRTKDPDSDFGISCPHEDGTLNDRSAKDFKS